MDLVDEFFDGALVLEVPAAEAEYARKMPGSQDGANKGDWCAT